MNVEETLNHLALIVILSHSAPRVNLASLAILVCKYEELSVGLATSGHCLSWVRSSFSTFRTPFLSLLREKMVTQAIEERRGPRESEGRG